MEISITSLENKNIADILIVTATPIETKALHRKMEPVCSDGLLYIRTEQRLYTLGKISGYNIIHCQCDDMGTQEVGASTLTTTNALNDWPCIKVVIMVGIAFGMYNEDKDQYKQSFCDVLVSSKIFPYENQRWNKDGEIKYRGKEHIANQHLIDAYSLIVKDWKHQNLFGEFTNVEICPLLTGEKLVDNFEKRNNLKHLYPEYRGGEMEGMGIASSCEGKQTPWIIVKAICDFADGKKGSTPEEEELKTKKQVSAAEAAVLATTMALTKVNIKQLIPGKINYFYRKEDMDLDKVFFMAYEKSCANFYLIRKVDNELQKHILSKHIWVYGETGIGKSELLRRTLVENEVEHIYIDLSLCDHKRVDAMFQTMYDSLCEYMGVETQNINGFQHVIKDMCNKINSYRGQQKICLFIEEIPFEEESNEFQEFVEKVSKMVVYMTSHLTGSKALLVMSSIAIPIKAVEVYGDKIRNSVHFVGMGKWDMEECLALVDLLSTTVFLQWETDKLKTEFIERADFSPRRIKSKLKECCSLEIGVINESIMNKLFTE